MSSPHYLQGLCLKAGPLGENDRLLTILSDQEGISRVAVPGARRPRSSLAGAAPLNFIRLHISRSKGLSKVRQLNLIRSYTNVGKRLETLAASQALLELVLMLAANNDPSPEILNTVLIHLSL